jgi:hypothetical protein
VTSRICLAECHSKCQGAWQSLVPCYSSTGKLSISQWSQYKDVQQCWTTFVTQETVYCNVRFQVLMSASMKMTGFWDVAPCSLVEVYWRLLITLMMEAASISETSVNFCQTTQCDRRQSSSIYHHLIIIVNYAESGLIASWSLQI